MNGNHTFMLKVEDYSRVLSTARSLAEGILRRLQDLHNRYPQDVSAKAIEQFLAAGQSAEKDAPISPEEGSFPP